MSCAWHHCSWALALSGRVVGAVDKSHPAASRPQAHASVIKFVNRVFPTTYLRVASSSGWLSETESSLSTQSDGRPLEQSFHAQVLG